MTLLSNIGTLANNPQSECQRDTFINIIFIHRNEYSATARYLGTPNRYLLSFMVGSHSRYIRRMYTILLTFRGEITRALLRLERTMSMIDR